MKKNRVIWLVRKRWGMFGPWTTVQQFSSKGEAERWRKEERSNYREAFRPRFRVQAAFKDNGFLVFVKAGAVLAACLVLNGCAIKKRWRSSEQAYDRWAYRMCTRTHTAAECGDGNWQPEGKMPPKKSD